MTPNELYDKLDELGLNWAVSDSFEGLRVINVVVDEEPDDD